MTLEARKIRLVMELRRQGVTDRDVLSAIERVPRELFVAPELAGEAYADTPLRTSHGQTISQPFIVALMTEAARLSRRWREKV